MRGEWGSYVLRKANVMDSQGDFTSSLDVFVKDGVVQRAGRNLSVDKDVRQLDAIGLWLMPGVFDCHAHVGMFSDSTETNLSTPYSLRIFETERILRNVLQSGVTWVRDAGGTDAGVKQASEQSLIQAPHMQVSIALLCQTGGHMDTYLPGEDISISTEGFMPNYPGRPQFVVDGPDQMVKAVRMVIRSGADWVKLCTTHGIFSGFGDFFPCEFSPEEIVAAVSEAKRAGKPVMVHAVGGEGITNAVAAGVKSLEHGVFLTEEQAEIMKRKGTFLVPTLMCYWNLVKLARIPNSPLPVALINSAEKLASKLGEAVRLADRIGIPIALGSDAASRETHGHSLEEITWLCRAGLSIEKALVSATLRGAELCGLSNRYGKLEPGYCFDAIILDRDPSDPEIFLDSNSVTGVFKDGLPIVLHPRFCCGGLQKSEENG